MIELRLQKALKDPSLIIKQREIWGAQNPQHRELIYAALDQSLPKGSFHSSISHAPGLGGFAISKNPIGFDIEQSSRVTERIIERISQNFEIKSAPSLASLWCAKEAAFKALRNFKQPEVVSQIEIEFAPEPVNEVEIFKIRNAPNFDILDSLGACISRSGFTYSVLIILT